MVRLAGAGTAQEGRPSGCLVVTPFSHRVHVPDDEVQQLLPAPRGRCGEGPPAWLPVTPLAWRSLGVASSCPQAFYMIRFHSFYPWHTGGDYRQLCSEQDLAMLPWVREFKYSHPHGGWGGGVCVGGG